MQESPVTTQTTDVLLWSYAKVIIFADKEFQLTAEVREILVVRCCSQQEHFAVLSCDERLDVLVSLALLITQVVAFIDYDKTIVTRVAYIYRLSHRHHISLEVIAFLVFVPHLLQVGRTNNQCAACISHLINLGYCTGCDGLTQTYNITYHGTSTLFAVKMASCYLDGYLLEVEHFTSKLSRQDKLLHTTTSIGTEVIGRLYVYVIRWYNISTSPTVVYNLNKFFGYVDAEAVIPAVVKPLGKRFKVMIILYISIEFSLPF